MTTDICLLVTRSPRDGHLGPETFDLAVSGGVFDRRIAVLFTGAGLGHLGDHTAVNGQRSLVKLWQSAEMFGIDRFLVAARETRSYEQLVPSPLQNRVEFLDDTAVQHLLRSSKEVMIL